jgi:hypothetical protein
MFFDVAIKGLDAYFNNVPEEEMKKKTMKICPHCGRALP